jgi:hypothetical protein
VFVSSYAEDKVTLEQLKQLAQPAMQNGAELSEMVDLFTANSERSLRKTLGDVQKRKEAIRQQDQALKQQQLEQQQAQFEQKMQMDAAQKAEEARREDMNKQLDRENRLQVVQLQGIANEGSYNPDVDTTSLLIQQTKLAQEVSKQTYDKVSKDKELSLREKELQLKEKDIDNKLKIAQTNKNKYDSGSKKK